MLNDHQNLILTLIFAMCLKIAPFPPIISHLNPDWVLLTLIYWSLALPYQQGLASACFTGLLTDVLVGCSLGEHTLVYALVIYTCISLHKRLRQFPLIQQMVFVFSCLFVAQLIIFWLESLRGGGRYSTLLNEYSIPFTTNFSISFWLSTLMGTLIWPFIHPALHFIRSFGKNY